MIKKQQSLCALGDNSQTSYPQGHTSSSCGHMDKLFCGNFKIFKELSLTTYPHDHNPTCRGYDGKLSQAKFSTYPPPNLFCIRVYNDQE